MENLLEKKVTLTSLIKYTLPTVIMMMFFSLYTIVDGMFISRFVGANALSSTNIVYPVINILIGIGVMFATGGSAIVAKTMGENKNEEAREYFTLITISTIIVGIVVEIICIIFINDIIYALGSTKSLFFYCKEYLFFMIIFTPFIILKLYFDYFLVTAGVPNLGLLSSVAGGILNIVLDYVFIVQLNMGVKGAALATCIGYVLPSIVGVIYFFNKNNLLHFVRPKFNFKIISRSCSNGMSEMVTQISSGLTTFLFNIVMIKFLGEEGVAAITIMLYMQFLLNAAYLGFTSGVSPRISYNYGRQDENQVGNLFKYSIIIISAFGVITFIMSRAMSEILISLFATKGSTLFEISHNGFMIFSISFLVAGINIFGSGMFTAFSNGKISAILSLLRTFVFFLMGIFVLPRIMGVDGVWLVVPFAEVATMIVSLIFMYKYKKEYLYDNAFAFKRKISVS
ncbi:MAG: MATE family efflux transporter [Terrisporobacter othiniensis]|uniref:Multidrug export protein MepA n=1 Tax=Terrisporobacter petrolearius TaxID=1460447 RepID=A0ABZ3FFS1_9FIRM|nr:MATE family efflux transporter [Terrisporobacter petrolearius]MDU4861081.1 MATE family efflux transporter [Terrisporobacter othiniensis]MDU6994715.1 MATE family efflux transporter [Terrisporobacter othiniensis]